MDDTWNDPEDNRSAMRDADRHNGEPGTIDDHPPPDDAGTTPGAMPPGQDTPTGTDPSARYEHPGYEDKSLGQAVDQDRELVDRLLDETGGDEAEAERRFRSESAGAPTLRRQS
jgi:hypothetical protein